MPSKVLNNWQLSKIISQTASSLSDFMEEFNADGTTPLREFQMRLIGRIVANARVLYGRRHVDSFIREFQKKVEAREKGLCEECMKAPTKEGSMFCEKCDILISKEEERINTDLAFLKATTWLQ